MNKLLVFPLAMLALLAESGCATYGPTWSEVSGQRYNVTDLNRRPTSVQKIDGYSSYITNPLKVEPGKHDIELAAPAPCWTGGGPLHTMTLTLEPCMRYYLNAQFQNRVQPVWEPVIDHVEPIAGCRTNVAAK